MLRHHHQHHDHVRVVTSAGVPFQSALPRDNIVEQMPPITTWGTQFAVAPTPQIRFAEVYVIVTADVNTQVLIYSDTTTEDVSR